ncbi:MULTISPECIES: hypothetical protein [Bacillus]|uniref:hypothetical protein n=1 Tax=Bacillus TaxID=1386 RepID=UPI00089E8512|nr:MULTISPECIES: hypothetical protein [Bacillus]PEQ52357.1 hypothetical protein CN473_15000 [Bacillus thuringiensis]PFO54902.1 hypothetical protein COJ71_01160 [Bacillus cereus]PGW21587.1 hypothetical protein COD95_17825 [Bacillus thuringiensis]SEG49476.1 hypothetical protein SAMN04487919_11162 [Bacillus sp. ok061]
MKWELYNKFRVQDKEANEFIATYQEKVQAAKEKVTVATKAYETILQREFSGEDVAAEKQKALDNIEKAQAAVKVAEGEHSKAHEYAIANLSGTITLDDLVDDWRNNVVPTVRREKVDPLRQKAQQGLADYYAAIQEILRIEDDHTWVREHLNEKLRKRKGATQILLGVTGIGDIPEHPSDQDWYNIVKYRQVPARFKK